jgi:L-threonate 2-dehydrogenase
MSDARRPSVGIIGVGAMGMAMAHNLRGRGYAVCVRDVRPEAEAEARAAGMTVCASPQALAAQVELVIVVVVNAQQIASVLFGAGGIAAGAAVVVAPQDSASGAWAPAAGAVPVLSAGLGAQTVMLCSTIAPQDTVRFAKRLASHGIATIDAPISGGPARALAGTMSMMLAAPAVTLARCGALLADLAEKRFVVSQTIGDGAKAKLVNNLLAGINLVAGAEALALSAKIGLDPRAMYDIIRVSSGASWVFEDRMARALADDYTPARAAVPIITKDVGLATALAASVAHPTPLGDAALARLRETVERGWAELDDAAVIKTYQR